MITALFLTRITARFLPMFVRSVGKFSVVLPAHAAPGALTATITSETLVCLWSCLAARRDRGSWLNRLDHEEETSIKNL